MEERSADDFTKVKMVEMPRNIVAGHDVLGSVREMCEGIHTGRTGTVITGTRTIDAAARDVLSYMDGYDMDVCTVGEASFENAQKAVISAVEAMTGCSVGAVNVHVGGVTLE